MEYVALEEGVGPLPAPAIRPLRIMIGGVSLLLASLGAFFTSDGLPALTLPASSLSTGSKSGWPVQVLRQFLDQDAGVVQFAGQGQKQNKATKKPDARAVSERAAAGPPGPLQWLTPLTAAKQPSAFFLYQRGQDVLRDSSISKGLLSEEAGYVYGARLPTGGRSTALGPELALVTSDPAHVLPGQLLHWGNEVFPDRLAAIDRLNGYNEFLPDHDRLRRGIVTVWRSDGSSCLAFWHYQVAPVHKYTPLTPYPTTFAPLSSPAQAGPPSFIFDTVGPPLTSPVETVQVSGEEPTECVVEPGVAAVRPRLRDRAIVGFTRRKRSDPDFVYKLMVETALSQSIALFTNLSVRGWNPTDWGASGVAQYLIQVVLELMNNVILVWALTPVAPLTEEEKLLVPLLASDLERENNPNRIEHFFQRNAACTYKDRFKVVFEKAKFYGTVGLGTGFVGGLLFTLFQRSDLTSPETWAFVLRLTLANTVMLSTSSTPRYNILAGLEMVAAERLPPQRARLVTPVARICNLYLGSRSWIWLSAKFGLA